MMPGQTTTLTDDAEIGGGDSRAIRFTLLGPGPVRVNTRPQRQPTHSESGELGEVWLLRPGSSKPAAKAKTAFSLSAGSVGLTFQATDADAAIPGLWTCEVRNWTDDSGTWHTTIFGSIAPEPPEQLATVSFDVELLNLMLATVVNAANLQVHLESSEDGSELCHAQWSKAVSKKLGQDGYRFNLPPQSSEAYGIDWTFAIPGIDSMAGSARLVLKDGPPRLSATIVFPPNVTLKGVGHVSVDLRVYDLAAGIDVMFDGTVQPTCSGIAETSSDVPGVGGIDETDTFRAAIIDAIKGKFHEKVPGGAGEVRYYLDQFFGLLLRLPPEAKIRAYRSDGTTLFVDHVAETHPSVVGPQIHDLPITQLPVEL